MFSLIFIGIAALGGCAPDYVDVYGPYSYYTPASTTRTSSVTITKVPRPDRALMEAPKEPDCGGASEKKPVAAAGKGAQEASGEDANADLALRIKLEYERECYRQAEARMRERLKQLQASTTQTIKAVDKSEQAAR